MSDADIFAQRIARVAAATTDRIREPVPDEDQYEALALVLEWLQAAEARGITRADLDGVSDLAMEAFDAVRARNFHRRRVVPR